MKNARPGFVIDPYRFDGSFLTSMSDGIHCDYTHKTLEELRAGEDNPRLVTVSRNTADKMFRITKKMMIYGRAYFKGDVIGEITDIGFSNVDQVIDRLVEQLPKDIPTGCMVQFRLMNCDSKKEVVYERSKGKGFM